MVEWQAEVSDEKISIFDNSLCHDRCHFIWVGGSCPPIFQLVPVQFCATHQPIGVDCAVYLSKHSYEFSELEQIEYLNNQANSGLMMLLDKMPVGVIKVRPDSNQVEWFNPFAELILLKKMGSLIKNYVKLLTLVWMRSEFMQTFQARDTLLTLILIKGYFTF